MIGSSGVVYVVDICLLVVESADVIDCDVVDNVVDSVGAVEDEIVGVINSVGFVVVDVADCGVVCIVVDETAEAASIVEEEAIEVDDDDVDVKIANVVGGIVIVVGP